MNMFSSTILLDSQTVHYHIFQLGQKFKAVMVEAKLVNRLPTQLTFWKENGEWKTYYPISEQVIQQFGSSIDHYLNTGASEQLKNSAVA